LQDAVCPSCDAVLRSVSSEPGALMRCLNCGTRFRIPGRAEKSAAAGTPPPRTRQPQSPGYWLLRIPAILALTASIAFTASMLYFELPKAMARARFEDWVGWAYLPLACWVGCFLFLITRSLARIDQHSVYRAWKRGIVQDALPPPPGSSLPFIAPLAIGGGLVPIVMISVNDGRFEESMIIGIILGAVAFFLGFAVEDCRQFLWRQKVLARACCEKAGVELHALDIARHARRGTLLLPAIPGLCGVGFIFASAVRLSNIYSDRSEVFLVLLGGGLLIAAASALFLLTRMWNEAVVYWRLAAGEKLPTPAAAPTGLIHFLTSFSGSRVLRAVVFIAWLGLLTTNRDYNYGYQPEPTHFSFVATSVIFTAGLLFLLLDTSALMVNSRSLVPPEDSGDLQLNPLFFYLLGMVLWLWLLIANLSNRVTYYQQYYKNVIPYDTSLRDPYLFLMNLTLWLAAALVLAMLFIALKRLYSRKRTGDVLEVPIEIRRLSLLPLAFISVAALWAALSLFLWHSYYFNSTFLITETCLGVSAVCLALWLAILLPQVWRWRTAQRLCLCVPDESSSLARLPFWTHGLILGAFPLAGIQAFLFACLLYEPWARNTFQYSYGLLTLGIVLLIFWLHYPTVWLATILGEFLRAEKDLELPAEE